jgi:hypothetical protein
MADNHREKAREVRAKLRGMPNGPAKRAVKAAQHAMASLIYGLEQYEAAKRNFAAKDEAPSATEA